MRHGVQELDEFSDIDDEADEQSDVDDEEEDNADTKLANNAIGKNEADDRLCDELREDAKKAAVALDKTAHGSSGSSKTTSSIDFRSSNDNMVEYSA